MTSAGHTTTDRTVALAAAFLLARRYSGEEEVVVGIEETGIGRLVFDESETTSQLIERVDALEVTPGDAQPHLRVEPDGRPVSLDDGVARSTHHARIAETMRRDPDVPIATIDIVPAQERARIDGWNDTERIYPTASYVELFAKQVAETPDAVAVVDATTSLTYAELDRRSNGLAHVLLDTHGGPGTLLGLLVDRRAEALVAILAIWKAGGAYVPLDPDHPPARLGAVLAGATPDAILVDPAFDQRLSAAVKASGLAAPPTLHPGAGEPRDAPPPVASSSPDDLAYVISTSGSTGTPKAPMVTQRGLVNHTFAMIDLFGLTDADVVAQNASFSFDVSVWQLTTPLLVGASVSIATKDEMTSALALWSLLVERGVTVLQIVPSMMRAMLDVEADVLDPGDLDRLRWVIPTGEALPVHVCNRWLRAHPHIPLANAYGPAECADDVTIEFIDAPLPDDATSVPIGAPIPNVTVSIRDPRGRTVPIGVPGQICVGGAGVGLGYRNAPELTAKAFVPDPDSSGARMYLTGDLGRWRPDGRIEFLGRIDHQVKVRGQRIELGEVETAIGSHPAVAACVASTREDERGTMLVGYVVATDELERSELRAHVSERVPQSMVPDVFVVLEELPLNMNGKVDRARLPEPTVADRRERDGRRQAPSTPTEARLADIWTDVLGFDGFGVDESFFALGGTSLLAATLVWRIKRDLDADLPLSAMVSATIEELAAQVDRPGEATPGVVPLRGGIGRPLFLIPGQGGSSLGLVRLATHIGGDRPVYGLDRGRVRGGEQPTGTFGEVARIFLDAMRTVQPSGPYRLAGWCMGGEVGLELAELIRSEGDEVDMLALLQTEHPDYPEFEGRTPGPIRQLQAVADRVSYELRAASRLRGRERADHVRYQLVGRFFAKLAVPFERILSRISRRLGRSYGGSERYHLSEWASADGACYIGHIPRPYDGPVTILSATNQPPGARPDPTLGWGGLLSDIDTEVIDAYHWDFLQDPQAGEVAAAITRRLDNLDAERTR